MFDPDHIMLACHPGVILAASMAMSAASAYSGYRTQKEQAKATADHQRRVGKQRVAQSVLNASDVRARQAEEQEANAKTKEDIRKRSMVATATARTSAGESGVGGTALDLMLDEYLQRESEMLFTANSQLESASFRIDRELERMGAAAKGGLLTTFRPINQPSAGAAALKFGSEAVSSYATYKTGGFGEVT